MTDEGDYAFSEEDEITATTPARKRSLKSSITIKKEKQFTDLQTRLPEIVRTFPQVEIFNFGQDQHADAVQRCVLCNALYKTRTRKNHYYSKHGQNSVMQCERSMWDDVGTLDTIRANKAVQFQFDCRSLPVATTQQQLTAYRHIVSNMESQGLFVVNKRGLDEMEDSLNPQQLIQQQPIQHHQHTGQQHQPKTAPNPPPAVPRLTRRTALSNPILLNQGAPQAPFIQAVVHDSPVSAHQQMQERVYQSQSSLSTYDPFQPLNMLSDTDGDTVLEESSLAGFDRDNDADLNEIDMLHDMGIQSSARMEQASPPQRIVVDDPFPLVSIRSTTENEPNHIFHQPIVMADLLDQSRDDPSRYVELSKDVTFSGLAQQHMQAYGFYRQVIPNQHPILEEYAHHLESMYSVRSFGRTSKSMTEVDVELPANKGGCQVYAQYMLKWAHIILRARHRCSGTLTLDDLIFCGPISKLFVQYLVDTISHGGSTILQYSKSLLDCLEWVNRQKEILISPHSKRSIALAHSISKCKTMVKEHRPMTDLQREANISLGLKEPKEELRYGLAVAFVKHPMFNEMTEIINRNLRDQTFYPTLSQYNIYIGYTMAYLLVTNASRNELMYKLRNHNIALTTLIKEKVDDEYFLVGSYPSPKESAAAKAATKLYYGHFCLTAASSKVVRTYEALRNRRIAQLKLEKCLKKTYYFFRTYDQEPLTEQTSRYLIFRVQKRVKFNGEFSCNSIRHKTAELDFFCSKLLQGGQRTAILLGHSADMQLLEYDKDRSKKVVRAFAHLQKIAEYDISNNGDAAASGLFEEMVLPIAFTSDSPEDGFEESDGDEEGQAQERNDEDENMDIDGGITASNEAEGRMDTDEDAVYENPYEMLEGPTTRDPPTAFEVEEPELFGPNETQQIHGFEGEKNLPEQQTLQPLSSPPEQPARLPVVIPMADISTMRPHIPGVPANLSNMKDPAVLNWFIKKHNTRLFADEPNKNATKDLNYSDFVDRRRARPIQNWPWVAVYYIPALRGAGLFARVDIPKDVMVIDYAGLSMTNADYVKTTEAYSAEHKKLVDDYLFHVTLANRAEMVIQAHMPVFDGRIILGRYINHTCKHPNLVAYKEEAEVSKGNSRFYICFKSTRKIRAGEQLLYPYGKEYSKEPWFTKECICLKCSPNMNPDKEADIPFNITRWNEDPIKKDESQLQMTQQHTHTPVTILQELIRRAKLVGIHLAPPMYDWHDSIAASVNLVGGGYLLPLRTPRPCEKPLQEALQQASHDAFTNGHPSVVVVRNRPTDKNPMMIVCGSVSSGRRFGNLVVYNQKHHEIHELKPLDPKMQASQDSIVGELRNCSLTIVRAPTPQWIALINKSDVCLDDVKTFRSQHGL